MFQLALRHLLSRKRQTFLTFLGILFASTAYVSITGFFLGFQYFLLEQLINNDAHVHVTPKEKFLDPQVLSEDLFGSDKIHIFWDTKPSRQTNQNYIDDPQAWYARLEKNPQVVAFSPLFSKQMLLSQGSTTVSATIVGCDAKKQMQVSNIADSIQEGQFSDLNYGGNRLFVGEGLLRKLGAKVSQTLLVSDGRSQVTPFKIIGTFKTGMKPIDETRAFGSLADVQQAAASLSQVNDIAIRIVDYTQALELAETWSQFGEDKVQSWDQINENFLAVFRIQDATRYMMITVLLIIAAFGIYNVISMTVTQKRQEIAILRSMGFESGDVIRLFFYQGLTLGLAGGLLGLLFGYWICLYLQTIPFGGGPLGGSGYLQVSITPMIYIQAMALALLSACTASIFPARQAGKLSPIEIIRYGD